MCKLWWKDGKRRQQYTPPSSVTPKLALTQKIIMIILWGNSVSIFSRVFWIQDSLYLIFTLKGPIHDSDFNRNRDVQPDRGYGCCWWSTHTRSDRSVQSFSLNRSSLIVTMSDLASDDQIAHQISENSDQQQPQQRPASCGGGCGCWSPYTGNLVEVAVGNCGCDWRSLSWMGPLRYLLPVCNSALKSCCNSVAGVRPINCAV